MSFNYNKNYFNVRNIPCKKDCPDRNAECHSVCKAYQEWKDNRDLLLAEKNRQKTIEQEGIEQTKKVFGKLRKGK